MAQLITKFIANGAVTAPKLGTVTDGVTLDQTGSGSTIEIKTGGISDAQINSSAAIAVTKLAALTASRAIATDSSGFLTVSATTSAELAFVSGVTSSIQTQLNATEKTANKGIANGYAGLDSGGKVPFAQLPSTLMIYLGAWDASTNTPTLADGTGANGDVYRVSVAGTQDLGSGPQTYFVGDFVIYNGTIWQRSPAADGVISVNGMSGAVTVNAINQLTGDVTAGPASGSQSVVATIASGAVTAAKLATVTDGITLDQSGSGSTLEVKTGGISNTQINAAAAIARTKIASGTANTFVTNDASGVLHDTAVTANRAVATDANGLPVASTTTATELGFVNGVTSSIQAQINAISGSSAVNNKETFTLSGTDITNQFIDLAHPIKVSSIEFNIQGGPIQLEGASFDYTVSLTGGAGGNTRITFVNGLATGGVSALVAGDILQIKYQY